ncbi:very-long-chain (3R)-3-hydroxyacyl-CoA dehydratase [Ranunculus cassubicifolius]
MSKASNSYLLLYNTLQSLGWTISLYKLLITITTTKSLNEAYSSAGNLICFLQTVSFLEVLHGAFGLVPSGILFPLMQWGGRTHWLLAIVRNISEVQEVPAVCVTFLAWSISEIIRYSQYALNCAGICPYWVTYLRYTAFIVLYPIGVALGEMWVMYSALPFIKEKSLYSDLFGGLIPFSYYYFVTGVLVVYPFLWLKLYLHLFKQRRSKLGKRHVKKV